MSSIELEENSAYTSSDVRSILNITLMGIIDSQAVSISVVSRFEKEILMHKRDVNTMMANSIAFSAAAEMINNTVCN